MTKKEFIKFIKQKIFFEASFCDEKFLSKLDEFFESNVVIPKGENRHPYADVLHEWVEGKSIQEENGRGWKNTTEAIVLFHGEQYRIESKTPIYEARVRIFYIDGKSETTERYFTLEEFNQFGFPMSCVWDEITKRERK